MKHIAIIGAGVAGLATAIFLAERGVKVTLLEDISDPTPIGAGLLLQPSGQAVLRQLNLLDTIREQAAVVKSLQGFTGRFCTLDLHYQHINSSAYGLGVHRATLHRTLWQRAIQLQIDIRLSTPIVDIQQLDKKVRVVDSSQSTFTMDAVVIASGTRSTLRNQLTIPQSYQPYPWGAYWAVLDSDEWPFPEILMQRYRGAHIMIGVLPTGLNPVTGKKCYSLFWSLPRSKFGIVREQGIESLVKEIATVWPEVSAWLSKVPNTTIAIAEYADTRMKYWNEGRVVVIGDAAHAMSPQLGQGANMALIDAYVLANCILNNESPVVAFQQYTEQRKKHIHYYQMTSNIMTPLYQSHLPIGWLRDAGTVIGRKIPFLYRQYLHTLCGAKQGFMDFKADIDALLK